MFLLKKSILEQQKEMEEISTKLMNGKYICELSSSDGRSKFLLEIIDYLQINDQNFFVSVIKINGINWDCKELLDHKREIETAVDDFEVNLNQVLIPSTSLLELISNIELWINQNKEFESQLVDLSFQKSVIKIENSNKSVLDKYKPNFIFEYSGSKISSLVSGFIVDQSCLSVFIDGLKSVEGISH